MNLPRFTLRSLLILVAIVAAYFGGLVTARVWFDRQLYDAVHSVGRAHMEAHAWWLVAEDLHHRHEPNQTPWPPMPPPKGP